MKRIGSVKRRLEIKGGGCALAADVAAEAKLAAAAAIALLGAARVAELAADVADDDASKALPQSPAHQCP